MSNTIKMTGRLLIFDKVDNIGLLFPKDCKITYPERIPFIRDFATYDPTAVLGSAKVHEDERGLVCDVELTNFDRDVLKELHDELPIGGYYNKVKQHGENGVQVIDSVNLVGISTTFGPADDELKIRVVED